MMALYRSLVYRELKLTRKHYFLYLVLYSLMGLLFMLPLVLSGEGSFDKKSGLSYETGKSIIQMFAVLLALLGAVTSGSTNNVQKMDINSGWKRYSYTLPLTAGEKAMSDFLLKILVFLLFGVLSSVFVLGISYGSGYDVMCFMLNMYLIMSAEIWLIDAIKRCCSDRFKLFRSKISSYHYNSAHCDFPGIWYKSIYRKNYKCIYRSRIQRI